MQPQITGVSIVYKTVCSGADQRKHQSSASLAFVRGIHRSPVNSPHKWPVKRKNGSIWWRHDVSSINKVCTQSLYLERWNVLHLLFTKLFEPFCSDSNPGTGKNAYSPENIGQYTSKVVPNVLVSIITHTDVEVAMLVIWIGQNCYNIKFPGMAAQCSPDMTATTVGQCQDQSLIVLSKCLSRTDVMDFRMYKCTNHVCYKMFM